MSGRIERNMVRAALLMPSLTRDQQRESRIGSIMREEEAAMFRRAVMAERDSMALIEANRRAAIEERERILAICRKYSGGSLTVKQIIKEIG